MWRVLASLLHLGNLEFSSKENEGTEITSQGVLKNLGDLIEVRMRMITWTTPDDGDNEDKDEDEKKNINNDEKDENDDDD